MAKFDVEIEIKHVFVEEVEASDQADAEKKAIEQAEQKYIAKLKPVPTLKVKSCKKRP